MGILHVEVRRRSEKGTRCFGEVVVSSHSQVLKRLLRGRSQVGRLGLDRRQSMQPEVSRPKGRGRWLRFVGAAVGVAATMVLSFSTTDTTLRLVYIACAMGFAVLPALGRD
jgi:hypothetical protein